MSTRLSLFAAILIAGAFSSGTAAETISSKAVVGSWTTRIPFSSGETSTLEISPTLHATFRRSFSDGHKPQDFESDGEMHTTDDVYIFNMKSDVLRRLKALWTAFPREDAFSGSSMSQDPNYKAFESVIDDYLARAS